MNWNNEILEELTELAKLPSMTPLMIARILGIDETTFLEAMQDKEHVAAIAYDKGKLIAVAEFDKKVVQLSNQGSGPAQTLQRNIRKETEYYKLLDYYGE